MAQKNKRTQKAVTVVKAVAPRPILTIPNRTNATALTNTELTVDEDTKVANFLALHGTVIPSGSTVADLIRGAIGDANPEKVLNYYSVRIGGGHRIAYWVVQKNGQNDGDPMQFAVTIRSIGDPPYDH